MHDGPESHTHAHGRIIYERQFTSVGIDIGSSTTHLMFSELVVGITNSVFRRRPEILDRQVIYKSPIIFTPFGENGLIDPDEISKFVEKCYRDAGVTTGQISSGAVICTGEAARRVNAQIITEAVAKDSGRFVCATAGHHFEALLAANGSGSVDMSRQLSGYLINLDIGGGTAKRTVIREGRVENISAINIGARLIVVNEDEVVIRVEPAGLAIANSIGLCATPGSRLMATDRRHLGHVMAGLLIEFLKGQLLSPLAKNLLVTDGPLPLDEPFWLVCSGGVSEYIYGDSTMESGDLGPALGEALRGNMAKAISIEHLLPPKEGIRATVIGASQFTLQVSGQTVFASSNAELPASNIPVLDVALNWENLTSEAVVTALIDTLATLDEPVPCALFLGGPSRFGYSKITELSRGIAAAFSKAGWIHQTVLIFSHDIANTVGRSLRTFLPRAPYICIDEIEVANLDYIDIDLPPDGESYYPIVVKSLIFGQRER